MAQGGLNKCLNIRFLFVDSWHLEPLADSAVCILESGGINSGSPKDRAVWVRVADAKSGLKSNLRLSNPSQTFDGGPLAIMFVATRQDPRKEISENRFAADEFLVTSERDDPVPLCGGFTMSAGFLAVSTRLGER